MNDEKTKMKPEDWMGAAERFGEQLAQGFEKVGERVVKALEHLDDLGGPEQPTSGVKVEDERKAPTRNIEDLLKGDVFELEGKLYMRLGPIPEARRLDEIDVVDLRTGDVRRLARGRSVAQVRTKLTIEASVR